MKGARTARPSEPTTRCIPEQSSPSATRWTSLIATGSEDPRPTTRRWPVRYPTATLIVVVSFGLGLIWAARDHSAPSWDQSSYLSTAWTHVIDARQHGFGRLLSGLLGEDRARGPLYTLLLSPMLAIAGPHPAIGVLLSLIAFMILIVTLGEISVCLAGPLARVPTVAVAATMPVLYGLSREILTDMLLSALSAATILAAIRCRGLSSRRWSVLLGLSFAATTLCKVTAPAFIVVPCAAAIVFGSNQGSARFRSRAANGAVASILALLGICWWYVPNFYPTIDYIRSTTSGPLSVGTGPRHPLELRNLGRFLIAAISAEIGWAVLLTCAIGGVLASVPLMRRWNSANWPGRRRAIYGLVLVASWLLVPTIALAAGRNQGYRLIAPGLAALSVVAGVLLVHVMTAARRAMTALVIVIAGYGVLMHTFSLSAPPILPTQLTVYPSAGWTEHSFNDSTVVYARDPIRIDHAEPIVDWVMTEAKAHHLQHPPVVGLLQEHPEVNGNTMEWDQLRRFGVSRALFLEVDAPTDGPGPFAQQFARLDAIIAIPDIAKIRSERDRLGTINSQLAGGHVSDNILSQFLGDITRMPIAPPGPYAELRWRSSR